MQPGHRTGPTHTGLVHKNWDIFFLEAARHVALTWLPRRTVCNTKTYSAMSVFVVPSWPGVECIYDP